jgi:hypothetical protein
LELQRQLLLRTRDDDPAPEHFEQWLAARVRETEPSSGPMRATALRLLEEWRLAATSPSFREWIARGAPSDDADATSRTR